MKYVREILIGVLFVFFFYNYNTSTIKNSDSMILRKEIETMKEEIDKRNINSINYLESRINRVAQSQDEYQISTTAKIDVLENKLGINNNSSKNTNTNINNIVISGDKK